MKTYRTCGECRNCISYKSGEFSLLCKKYGVEVCADDSCENFVPKEQILVKLHANTMLRKSELIIAEKLEAAAKKCATTGLRSDLQNYLKLRREML